MKKTLLLMIIIPMLSCSRNGQVKEFDTRIVVPKKYMHVSLTVTGYRQIENYSKSYRNGFRHALDRYVNSKIDELPESISGHPAAIEGFFDGFNNGKQQIESMERINGRTWTNNYIEEFMGEK